MKLLVSVRKVNAELSNRTYMCVSVCLCVCVSINNAVRCTYHVLSAI